MGHQDVINSRQRIMQDYLQTTYSDNSVQMLWFLRQINILNLTRDFNQI